MQQPPIELTSFGYLHQPTGFGGQPIPPTADRTEDVRERLRDPAAARDILDLDGRHPRVQAVVLATPGAPELLDNLTAYALLPAGPRRIAIGCGGGKHRACALVELLAPRLLEHGVPVTVRHLHAHLPRVVKDQTPGQPRWKRCGHGPGQLHPGDKAVVDAFKKMLTARRDPAPFTEGDDVAVQVPNGVERARLEPRQDLSSEVVELVLVHPDTGEILTRPMPCPRTLILGPWDYAYRPLTHAAVGHQLPDSAMSEPILSHLAGQPADGPKEG
ncbi:hypothetical protein [Streptomyces sp. NPDC020597]|uniref:RapZ C-terminal domain-containing protein n=1 Tax=unclassified Streptomyces TaxID=2593676 RepID=UPI003794A681